MRNRDRHLFPSLLAWGLAAFAALAPLPFGAVGPGGRLALEIGAGILGLLWCVAVARGEASPPPRLALAGVAALVALALVQTLPLGAAPPSATVPAAIAAAETNLLGTDALAFDRPAALSVDRPATASALRTGAALACVFLAATAAAASGRGGTLAWGLLCGAAFQALFGIAVLAGGADTVWGEPKVHYLDCATGTFVNRNHFAAYVAAGLAAGCGLALETLRRALRDRRPGRPLLSDPRTARAALAGTLCILALAGLLLSFSRAGIALGIAATGATALVGSAGVASRRSRGILALSVVALAAFPLVTRGAGRLADRYQSADEDLAAPGGRLAVWRDALRLAAERPLAGSGFGTFAVAYPSVRSPEVRLRYSHAHNDPLQLAAEAGIAGLTGLTLLLAAVAPRAASALRGRHGALAAGFAAGACGFAVHACVDFPFHIPGAAVACALAAGAVAGLPWNARS